MDGQNIFYHYTSINSLYNIIMSRELWLTNLKSSNDKSERYYTVNHMLKDMDEIINNSTDDNFKQYLSLLKKSFETHMPDLKNYLKKSDGYSLSLTDKKDNANPNGSDYPTRHLIDKNALDAMPADTLLDDFILSLKIAGSRLTGKK